MNVKILTVPHLQETLEIQSEELSEGELTKLINEERSRAEKNEDVPEEVTPVSYTHLTLPTIHVLCRSRWSPYH